MNVNELGQKDYSIGEVFEENGVLLTAIESNACKSCFLNNQYCYNLACGSNRRSDKKGVIFIPVEKQNTSIQDKGEVSDGYHTFNELYEFRKVYNAAFFNELVKQGKCNVVKSKKHYDGEECFGGGWFIVVAELPTGQVSNHYELKDWDLFKCKEVDKAPKWDGHTPQDVIKRIVEYLKLK